LTLEKKEEKTTICPQCGQKPSTVGKFCEFCGAESASPDEPSRGAANPFRTAARAQSAVEEHAAAASVVPSGARDAWKRVFVKYCDVKGRASRTEFWHWQLFLLITAFLPIVLGSVTLHHTPEASGLFVFGRVVQFSALAWILVCLCPTYALIARRQHDFDASSDSLFVFLLLSLVCIPLLPYAYLAAVLSWGLIPGTDGPNRYGAKPWRRGSFPEGLVERTVAAMLDRLRPIWDRVRRSFKQSSP